jgi:hypothetical protein
MVNVYMGERMNSRTQRARLKGVVLGVILATGLVIGGGKVANAVDPKQCVEREVLIKNIRIIFNLPKEDLYKGLYEAIEKFAGAAPDQEVAAWSALKAKYGCLLGQEQLDDIFKQVVRTRGEITAMAKTGKYSLKYLTDQVDQFARLLAKKSTNTAVWRVREIEGAVAGQVLKGGTEKVCKTCTGALTKAGTKEFTKRAGIGILGGLLGLAAGKAFGAPGDAAKYAIDPITCGKDDMINVEYDEVKAEYECQQGPKIPPNCPGQSKNIVECGRCCDKDLMSFYWYSDDIHRNTEWKGCMKACDERFPPRYCSNRAGQKIKLKDQINGTYQGECNGR